MDYTSELIFHKNALAGQIPVGVVDADLKGALDSCFVSQRHLVFFLKRQSASLNGQTLIVAYAVKINISVAVKTLSVETPVIARGRSRNISKQRLLESTLGIGQIQPDSVLFLGLGFG